MENLNATSEILCSSAGHVAHASIRKIATTPFAGGLRDHQTREFLHASIMFARDAASQDSVLQSLGSAAFSKQTANRAYANRTGASFSNL